jgi:hypothetical protein
VGQGTDGLDPSGPRQRDDRRRQIGQPGQGHLRGSRAVAAGQVAQNRVALQATAAAGATQRSVGQHADPLGHAALDDAVPEAGVLPGADLDLHPGDLDDGERLLELRQRDVAQADLPDLPLALERRQRPDAGGQRRSGIDGVELVDVDPRDAEGAQAGLAGRRQVAGTAVGDPPAGRPGQPALGGDADSRGVAAPGRERATDQPLVVANLRGVPTVGVGSVQERDARVERRLEDGQGPLLVALGLGRKAHAAHRQRRLTPYARHDR